MSHVRHQELARRLLGRVREKAVMTGVARTAEIPRSRYVSHERFLAERERVFAVTPQIVAHASDFAEAGACMTVTVAGVDLLVLRGSDGELRAFRNACRHRSTRLVQAPEPCRKKAIVCPYHGWTYDLSGTRIHVPHAETFGGADAPRDALSPAFVAEHGGLVWVSLAPFDVTAHLGAELSAEIASLDMASLRVHTRSEREVRGNWKLVVDAFTDGYHIRHLHRDTVYRFFFDAQSEADPVGRHIRAATARRTLAETNEAELASIDLRKVVTPTYVLFPNTVLVFHPDYTSILRMEPLAADRTRFSHVMLVERSDSPELAEHFDKSFRLIDEGVFASEDLVTVEAMQAGMMSSTDDTLLFGDLELAAKWFHDAVDRTVDGA